MSNVKKTQQIIYPEVAVGGFSRVDGTIHFYQRVNALIGPHSNVLDVGAGRGSAHHDDESQFRKYLRNFKGRSAKVVGIDVDPAIFDNPSLDEAHLIENDQWPVADGSIDVAFSDYTFEHIPDAEKFASEAHRVLKSGGWLCARTPNKNGYISVASRLIPRSLHKKVLAKAQPDRKEEDVFPTTYVLNTRKDIERAFPAEKWRRYTYAHSAEPAYFGSSVMAWRLAKMLMSMTPSGLQPTLMVFLQKK